MRHGTATGWRWHKCRCPACHRALLVEAKATWAARQLRRGRDPASRVPAGRVRQRIEELVAAGMSATAVAQAAQVSAATISRLRHRSTKRCSRIVAEAILAVTVP